MTVLIAGGDSFTYGSELPSQEHAWANLLATRKGWNICNTARPAASNSAIRRNVMNAVHKYKELDLFVAVMWSTAATCPAGAERRRMLPSRASIRLSA